jgi:hypothetical protein
MTLEAIRYAVHITAVGANVEPSTSGYFYLEVCVNGDRIGQTAPERMRSGQVIWNKRFKLYLDQIEPSIPAVMSLTLYKKRCFWTGYTVIGSCHFSTADLAGMLDKGTVRSRAMLHLRRKHIIKLSAIHLKINLASAVNAVGKVMPSAVAVIDAPGAKSCTPHAAVPGLYLSGTRRWSAPIILGLVVLLLCGYCIVSSWCTQSCEPFNRL